MPKSDLEIVVTVDAKEIVDSMRAALENIREVDVTKTVGYLNGKTKEEMEAYFEGYREALRFMIGHFETRV